MTAVRGLCVQTACVTVADMRRETKNIALCASFAAISVVLAFLSSAFPNMSLTILALCGVVSAFALSECGYKYAVLMFVAVSVISAILVPDKSCVVLYVLLFGHYPIVKTLIERVGKPWLAWIIKLVIVNLLAFAALYVTLVLLDTVGESVIMGRKYFFLFYNVAVILYDICIGKMMFLYMVKRGRSGRFH